MTPLAGRRVLVVEDEPIVAMALEDMLFALGAEVVGPALRLEDALDLADAEAFDAALLDVNLRGRRSYPVADVLKRRGIPFAFVTGYGSAARDEAHTDVSTLAKPYRIGDIATTLAALLQHPSS